MKTKEIYFLLKITMSQAAMTNRHRLSRSNSRLHFPQFWAWKSEVRMLSLACRRLPGRQTDRQTNRKLSVSLSYKVARSTDEGPTLATSFNPNYLHKGPSSKHTHPGSWASTKQRWRDTHILQPLALISLTPSTSPCWGPLPFGPG